MHPRQTASAAYVRQLVETGPLPRNQIATLSGLTNTYIRDLERGAIANVERGKIIALGLAFNRTLLQIDEMLKLFDRAPLTSEDIPRFLAIAGRCKSSSVLLPVRNTFSFDLHTIAALMTPGQHSVATYKPMAALQPAGYWLHQHRQRLDEHPLYSDLVAALSREMRAQLDQHLGTWPVTQFVSQAALAAYVSADQDPVERRWHLAHLRRMIGYLERYETLNFYLTEESSRFLFTLKTTPSDHKGGDRLVIYYLPPSGPKRPNVGLLAGFTTGNPVVIATFKEELEVLKTLVIDTYRDKADLIRYLEALMDA
ncbi:MAG: hypothetical protein QNJ22_00100 [Desulfosarcinaceae bacterium]|nr:hypothetical protein [Desulfosarcinaceae bacterium]